MAEISVKLVKSPIGSKPKHRGALRSLGLTKIGNINTFEDRPEIRGTIARVSHLVEVSDAKDSK